MFFLVFSDRSDDKIDGDENDETQFDDILDLSNPVFKEKRPSSKINIVIEKISELKKKQRETGVIEKTVIVSQWTSMLNIMKKHIQELGKTLTIFFKGDGSFLWSYSYYFS